LVVAMPFSWGAGGLEDKNPKVSASLGDGVRVDVFKVKETLCHIPPGNPGNAENIVVGPTAVAAHLAHGDYLGECHSVCDGVPSLMTALAGGSMLRSAWLSRRPPPRRRAPPAPARV